MSRKDGLNELIKKGGYGSDDRSYETESTGTPERNKTCRAIGQLLFWVACGKAALPFMVKERPEGE